jgi:hypothetical protein
VRIKKVARGILIAITVRGGLATGIYYVATPPGYAGELIALCHFSSGDEETDRTYTEQREGRGFWNEG